MFETLYGFDGSDISISGVHQLIIIINKTLYKSNCDLKQKIILLMEKHPAPVDTVRYSIIYDGFHTGILAGFLNHQQY